MSALDVSLACGDHDRVMAVVDGAVTVPGVRLTPTIMPTGQLFPIAVQEARFDVTELSLSSHLLQVSRGAAAYTAIPAFVSRAFRHNGFFKRAGAGIETLADFRGRAIGVPEHQMTAALCMRGIMEDDFGVRATDVRWRTGALDAGVRRERLTLTPPPDLSITPVEDGRTLQDLNWRARSTARWRRTRPGRSSRATRASRGSFPISRPPSATGAPAPASSRSCM